MQKLTLIFSSELDIYLFDKSTKSAIEFLEYFLTNIQSHGVPTFINWALDPTAIDVETNSTWLKKKDNHILIGSLFSDRKDRGPIFKISIPEFIKVITAWKQFLREKPEKIIITQLDDGTMTIVGENAKKSISLT